MCLMGSGISHALDVSEIADPAAVAALLRVPIMKHEFQAWRFSPE